MGRIKSYLLLLILLLGFGTLVAQPANDDCSTAQTIAVNGTCYNGTTVGADDSWQGILDCQSGNNHRDVWYRFVATGTTLAVNVTPGTLTGNIEFILLQGDCTNGFILSGSFCGASPLIDNINGLDVDSTYYILISSSTSSQGTFNICLTNTTPPPSPGQDCNNAAILCNGDPFSQSSSTAGYATQEVNNSNSCWGLGGGERQSKWFKFTVGCSGTLEFNIRPVVASNDYDWALWNVTSDPTGCSTKGSSIACNWSGCTGSTGISSCSPLTLEPGAQNCGASTGGDPCGSGSKPRAWGNWADRNGGATSSCISNTLNVVAGNTYALLVDNFTVSNSGFSLTFGGACGGGTAVIGPTADFSYTSTGCGSYSFTKNCQTTNSTFVWQFGDGNSANTQDASHTYATSGDYTISLQVTDALGCIATYSQTITVVVVDPPVVSTPITYCKGDVAIPLTATGTSLLWYADSVLGSGSSTAPTPSTAAADTLSYYVSQTISGCVSPRAKIDVIIKNTSVHNESTAVCLADLPYIWNGLTFNSAGSKTAHFTNAVGCDSAATMTLTVKSPTTSTNTHSVCITNLPYIWNGLTFNAAGSQTAHFTNAAGCDSAATMTLTVKSPTSSTNTHSVCVTNLPYIWNGLTFNTAGTQTAHLTNSAGCDSAATLILTVNPVPVVTVHGTNPSCQLVCDGLAFADVINGTAPYTYSWSNGASTRVISGLCENKYKVVVTDSNGCSSTSSPVIPSGCFQIKSILVDACSPVEYEQEMVFFQVGSAPINRASLTADWPTPTDTWRGLCTNSSFITNVNATITGGGKLLAAPAVLPAGADVVLITSNVPNTSFNSFANLTDTLYVLFQCSGNVAGHFANNTASPAGSRTFSMNFGAGCTDTVTYRTDSLLNINGAHGGVSALNDGAYANFTTNGTASYKNYGCVIPYTIQTDSIVLNAPLAITPTFNSIAPVCQNTTPPVLPTSSTNTIPITGTWNTTVNTASPGTISYTFTPTAGQCATTTTLDVTVKAVSTSNSTHTACTTDLPYIWNGLTFNSAGSQTAHLTNAAGCDSAATMTLTVNSTSTSTNTHTVCTTGLPYIWNGLTFNAAGSQTAHLTNAKGCDSAATMTLTVNSPTTSTNTHTVCTTDLPYIWNGLTFNSAGSQTAHFTNANGCDSAATMTLTVNSPSTSTNTHSICSVDLPYIWNGLTFNSAGSQTAHFTNAKGCDSAATMTLTVNSPTTSINTHTVCTTDLPYIWNGLTFNSAGSQTAHLTNAKGCDSAATMTLTVNSPTTSINTHTVCTTDLPYIWNGLTFNSAGSQTAHLTNAKGCDSAATMTLTVNSPTTSTNTHTVCSVDLPYIWNGLTFNSAGSQTAHFTNASGCDSAATMTLTVNSPTTSTNTHTVCTTDLPYIWNGLTFNSAGSQTAHFTNAAGCDSAATMTLTVNSPSTSTSTHTVCTTGLPYIWNGLTFNSAGSQTAHFTNAAGCDSAATMTLTVNSPSTSTNTHTVCTTDLPYIWNGLTFNSAGSQTAHFTNAKGCDSAATMTLTVNSPSTSTNTHTVCTTDLPYIWNGLTFNAAGSQTAHFTNAAGCDSAATMTLTVNSPTSSTNTHTVCTTDLPYIWNGLTFNSAGSQTAHFTNAAGCDSAATMTLTVNSTSTSTNTHTVCTTDLPYIWNGLTFNSAGSQTAHFTNAAGCDSAATMTLTVNSTSTSTNTHTVCTSDLPYIWNGLTFNAAGSQTAHFTNAAGCDSAATMTLTVNSPTTSTNTHTVCTTDLPYIWNGLTFNAAGSQTAHFTNAAGCDSAATMTLTVNSPSTSTNTHTVCTTDLPYIWNGLTFNAAGSQTAHFTNAAGCDSAATMTLTVNSLTTSTNTHTVCTTDLPYIWNGLTFNAAGSQTAHFTNAAGCDSAATMTLTVNSPTTSTNTHTVCTTDLPYIWNGLTFNSAGSKTAHFTNANGCDSAATMTLTVNSPTTSTNTHTVCTVDLPYIWNGLTFNAAGSQTAHFTNAKGCDSAATMTLTVNSPTTSAHTHTVCTVDLPYIWNGLTFNSAGSQTAHFTNAAGCDSAATMTLTVNSPTTSTNTHTVCTTDLPYIWNGLTFNSAGSQTAHFTNAAGCDSAATMTLTVNSPTTSTNTHTVCTTDLPYIWNGLTFNSAGSQTAHFTNAAGCDSAATMTLTVNSPTTSTNTHTVCTTDLPYIWNGLTFNAAGSQTAHFTNSAGCDSAATMTLTVNSPTTSTNTHTVCTTDLPYIWNSLTFNSAGSQTAHFTNAAGCDSAATMTLTVNSPTTSTNTHTVCTVDLPYIWNGLTFNAAGSQTAHFTNSAGCDSAATMTLTVNSPTTSTNTHTVCTTDLPYIWNSLTFNSAGSQTAHFTNAAGCDSAATMTLTVNSPTTSTNTHAVCTVDLPYIWNGLTFNSAGSQTAHFTNAAGCDSAATMTLTVNSPTTSINTHTVCSVDLPYVWNGLTFNSAGSQTAHLTNAAGCDSAATMTLTVNSPTTSTNTHTVCTTDLPYIWNGLTFNSAGSQTAHFTNAAGCDSAATMTLTVNSPTTSTNTHTVCTTDLPYIWNGLTFNAAGSQTAHFTNAAGCDSAATMTLAVNSPTTSTNTHTVCTTDLPYIWNGLTFNAAGSQTAHFTNAAGCDSAATMTLTVNSPTTSTNTHTVCTTDLPYIWNGLTFNAAGSQTAHFTNANGCDSAATMTLTVNSPSTSTNTHTVCTTDLPYIWNGLTFNAAGSQTAHFTNVVGCDSAATMTLTVNSPTTSTNTHTVCTTDLPYIWNGLTFNAAGSQTAHFTNAAGCDSAATMTLTVSSPTTSTNTHTVCTTDLPYIWNGLTFNAAGSQTAHFTNAKGCDSAATMTLTVNSPTTSAHTHTVCTTDLPYIWNGLTFNSAGSQIAHFTNAAGCDSAATMTLTVNSPSTSTNTHTVCTTDLPYIWNGLTFNSAGSQTAHFTNAAGCDSAATMTLTVNSPTTSTNTHTVCTTDLPYIWNGLTFNSAGSQTAHFTNVAGCDSAATMTLTVNSPTTSTNTHTVCTTDLPYIWNGLTFNSAGSQIAHFTNAAGCDSAATMTLTVNSPTTSTNTYTVCTTDLPYIWNGLTFNSAGSQTAHFTNAAGCDSAATMTLTVNSPTTSTNTHTVCTTDLPYIWNGLTFNSPGSQTAHFTNANGCDSAATMTLTVNSPTTSAHTHTVCTVDLPYIWNGLTFNSAGSQTAHFTNAAGCDSAATMTLTVNSPTTSTNTHTVCTTDLPYIWNGLTFNAAGSQTAHFTNAAGCDSAATMTLTVNSPTTSTNTHTVCTTDLPYIWNGLTFNAAGSQTAHFTNAAGCDSAATMTLTVKAVSTSFNTLSVCSSALPYLWNGLTFNAPGTQTAHLINAVGCDSAATLVLTVKLPTTSITPVSICPSQLPYNWNGNVYNSAGSYQVKLINAAGCDSIARLELKVQATITNTNNVTVCEAQLPYSWNGNTYSSAGSYTIKLTNVAGCDSLVTLVLTVKILIPANLGNTQNLCPNETIILTPGKYDHYLWQDGSTASTYRVTAPGIYSVTVRDNFGCSSSDQVSVNYLTACGDIFFPTAITPNGDGLNDKFGALGDLPSVTKYSLYIYNRYGELVFSTTNPYERWDGIYKGGVWGNYNFVWYSKYTLNGKGDQLQKGNVTVIK